MIRLGLTILIISFSTLLFSQKKFNFEMGTSIHSNHIISDLNYDIIEIPAINPGGFISIFNTLKSSNEIGITIELFMNTIPLNREYLKGKQNSISLSYRKQILAKGNFHSKLVGSLNSKTLLWNGVNINHVYTRHGTITWTDYYYDYFKIKYYTLSLGLSNIWTKKNIGLNLGIFTEYGLQRSVMYDNVTTKVKLIENFNSDRNDLSRLFSFNLKFGFQF